MFVALRTQILAAAQMNRAGVRVDVRSVSVEIGHRSILEGVDLTLSPGERLGVIGPNGSGKSTLLRCLYAWHAPTRGRRRSTRCWTM